MTTAKAVLGVLAGMAAGAALGVLFAPEKGTVTRRRISRKGEDLADSIEEMTEAMEDRIEQKFDELVDALNDRTTRQKNHPDADKAHVL
jgi:gas vesicle protein